MPGGGGPGHRPVPAETPHRQKAHPAPAAAGEGGECCQHPCSIWGSGCPPPRYQRIKAPCICLVTQQSLGMGNAAAAMLVRKGAVCIFSLNLKSDPSAYNFQKT